MFEKTEIQKAINAAEKVQNTQSKISSTIKAEEARLSQLVKDRLTAEKALSSAEAGVALGEATDSKGAQKSLDAAMSNIGRQGIKLSGLRSRLAELAPELEAKRKAISDCLPDYIASLKSEFASEWSEAVAAFERVMAKRAALERITGKFDLAEPRVMSSEVPATTRAPWLAMEALGNGLNEVAGWSFSLLQAEMPLPPGVDRKLFDPSAIYELVDQRFGQPGEPVMEASFAPGLLANLVQVGHARPYASRDWANATHAGASAARRISRAQEDERAAQREAELRRAYGG